MYNEEEIADSIEFCKDIKKYYEPQLYEEELSEEEKKRKMKFTSLSSVIMEHTKIFLPSVNYENRRQKREETAISGILENLLESILCIALALGIAFLINTYVGTHTRVDGESMENTLYTDDCLIIDKLTYRFSEPKRFDIIVFPINDDEDYIKRIIGLPGETVQIINGYVYINGRQLSENVEHETMLESGIATEPVVLNADEYFVLGDNRNHSTDSRMDSVKMVKRDDIIGKAVFRFYPLETAGKIE